MNEALYICTLQNILCYRGLSNGHCYFGLNKLLID